LKTSTYTFRLDVTGLGLSDNDNALLKIEGVNGCVGSQTLAFTYVMNFMFFSHSHTNHNLTHIHTQTGIEHMIHLTLMRSEVWTLTVHPRSSL
jgi:hypothetical protein